jgi:hypothetical protein
MENTVNEAKEVKAERSKKEVKANHVILSPLLGGLPTNRFRKRTYLIMLN